MIQIKKTILTLALLLTAVTGARADQLASSYSSNATLNAVTVSASMEVTIATGVTVTINNGLNITSGTLTVKGPGTLVVNGKAGSNGYYNNNGDGGPGGNGGVAISGNIIVQGGATVKATGGNGGSGGWGERGEEYGPSGSAGKAFTTSVNFVSSDYILTDGSNAITATQVTSKKKVVISPKVAVNSVTLAPTSATLTVGETETVTLIPTVLPDDATDKTVTWTTSDASVATVADGVVTAVAAGTATITATATNGTVDTSDDKTATCTVTVVPAPVDPTKPDTPTPEPVTPASDTEVPADTTPSGSSSPAPVVSAEQSRAMTVSNFVERLYLTALNRSYDVTGRDNWVDQIINKDASGSSIARGFFNSQEFIARELDNEEFVNTLYRVFFDREPDTQGFTNWINALENGATRSEVINEFAGSTEWTSMCARYGINA